MKNREESFYIFNYYSLISADNIVSFVNHHFICQSSEINTMWHLQPDFAMKIVHNSSTTLRIDVVPGTLDMKDETSKADVSVTVESRVNQ